MATEFQFSVFRLAYEEENVRYAQLEARARFYLTVETFYLAAIAFKFKDVQEFATEFGVPLISYVSVGVILIVAVLFTVLATRIRIYEAAYDLRDIVDSFGAKPPTDAEFIVDRMADCVVATERNCRVNDRVARWLEVASWLLFGAVSLHFSTFLWAYIHQLKS
jgi:uncharacterized membrane protein (DUF485 family)